MRDALRAAQAMPQFLDAATVHLIEVSASLRAAQEQTLASLRSVARPGIVRWMRFRRAPPS